VVNDAVFDTGVIRTRDLNGSEIEIQVRLRTNVENWKRVET
jgi:hypothetical protein